ncbi:MAG: hypothetical protein ABEJ78_05255 [Haloferacaceae archaeon]
MKRKTILVVGEGSVSARLEDALSDRYRVRTTAPDDARNVSERALVVLTPAAESSDVLEGELRRSDCPVVAVCDDDAAFDVDDCHCGPTTPAELRAFVDEVLACAELGDRASACYEVAERLAELRAGRSMDELRSDPEYEELRSRLADEHDRFAERLRNVPADKAFPATLDDAEGEESA